MTTNSTITPELLAESLSAAGGSLVLGNMGEVRRARAGAKQPPSIDCSVVG
jgi:hypothetical protein